MKYVYKIVAAIGALATIPMLVFLKLFYFKAKSLAVQLLGLIGSLRENSKMEDIFAETGGKLPENIADSLSFYDLFDLVSGVSDLSGDGSMMDKFEIILVPVAVLLVISVLIIVCAILTAIFAFAAKNNRMVIYSSICGIGLSVMFSKAFEAVAAPFIDQTISLGTVLDSVWASLLGELEVLTITNEFWFIPVAFACIIVWTVLYNYTLPENEKKERKLMLGEEEV